MPHDRRTVGRTPVHIRAVDENAGAVREGRIGEVDEDILRKSFELNFYGHHRVAQAAVKNMLCSPLRQLERFPIELNQCRHCEEPQRGDEAIQLLRAPPPWIASLRSQ